MDHFNAVNSVRILYFSGTGGTKRFAEAFEKELKSRGITVFVKNLGESLQEKKNAPAEQEIGAADLNILLYSVYAMDAPRPVYDWIGSVTGQEAGKRIAVLSVSGGGEMWPNTGSRSDCCKALEDRGFRIVYDRMLCMPANVMVNYSDHLVMHLLNVIPRKVTQIVEELLAGRVRRTESKKGFFCKKLSRVERKNSYQFAQKFQIADQCTGCGWCEQNCPTRNIEIPESASKPRFKDQCVICMRCVYGCPTNAIKVKGNFVLKNGFDLSAVERRMKDVELAPVEKCCKGLLYKGVKEYLLDKY
ncbi:MAG: EFR1 family ferrodoxin [Eubacteriales bacterium]|nr:EFR1 family ferrodoxin [Eubacteriales bacterium]